VKLFSEKPSQISSHDFLRYILGSDDRIITSKGVSLRQRVIDEDGKIDVRRTSLDAHPDSSTDFILSFVDDPNSPHKDDKNPHKLTITPKTQGGGYHFSFEHAGHTETFTVDFLFPN
jgi:hypothetical protein